jgi:hypothetical protein
MNVIKHIAMAAMIVVILMGWVPIRSPETEFGATTWPTGEPA